MERIRQRVDIRVIGVVIVAAAVAILARHVLAALAMQLAGGYVLMGLALPICRRLERKLSRNASAALALMLTTLAAVGLMLLLIPPLIRQLRQITSVFPAVAAQVEAWLVQGQELLLQLGVDLSSVRDELFSAVSSRIGTLVSMMAGLAGQIAQTVSKLALSPLVSFYLLRDRRKISSLLMLLLPVRYRTQAARAAREMRRETAGFLRGQLLVSAAVGSMTALGLAIVGTPGFLALGLLMALLELVPYIGPLMAGIPAVLLALPGGIWQAVWTLVVLVSVQQLEGSFLSPRLMSGATNLHPLLVLLAVSAGGIFAGTIGMILALPIVVSVRGALRGVRTQQV